MTLFRIINFTSGIAVYLYRFDKIPKICYSKKIRPEDNSGLVHFKTAYKILIYLDWMFFLARLMNTSYLDLKHNLARLYSL